LEWADELARRLGAGLELHEPYPDSWGVWPGTVLYATFVWVELVFYGSSVPLSIAFLVLSYSVIASIGMAVFGKDAWLRGVRLSRSSSGSLPVLRLPRCG
jgi:hypothetical protein